MMITQWRTGILIPTSDQHRKWTASSTIKRRERLSLFTNNRNLIKSFKMTSEEVRCQLSALKWCMRIWTKTYLTKLIWQISWLKRWTSSPNTWMSILMISQASSETKGPTEHPPLRFSCRTDLLLTTSPHLWPTRRERAYQSTRGSTSRKSWATR